MHGQPLGALRSPKARELGRGRLNCDFMEVERAKRHGPFVPQAS